MRFFLLDRGALSARDITRPQAQELMAYAEGLRLRTEDRMKAKGNKPGALAGTRNDTRALFPEAFPDG